VTGFPEMLDGRIKTLHPKIHGGLLAKKTSEKHMEDIKTVGITPIDMVVCNFYDFGRVAYADVSEEKLIEEIDIGGPAMVRSAGKNFRSVCVVPSVAHYSKVIEELERLGGSISAATRLGFMVDAFKIVAKYDATIAQVLESRFSPDSGLLEKPS